MTIKKFSDFIEASGIDVTNDDIFLITDNTSGVPQTKKVTLSTLKSFIGGANVSGTLDQFANTSSSQLRSIITDETGSGFLVFNNSPSLTGIPLAPTATSGTNTNQIASTAFVRNEISNLVASAPSTLDTLNELATALGNDASFSTTIINNLSTKASLSGATFTGSISSPSGNFASLKINNSGVSLDGHSHIISDISNLQTILNNKQPSGNYATVSHTHSSSEITNFNNTVSGLLPITNILPGTNTSIISSGTTFTISSNGGSKLGTIMALI